MPRPFIKRMVRFKPGVTYFKPAGVPVSNLKEVVLTFGEFEAIRLKDHENIDQVKAAKKMKISQPTFNRLLRSARKKIAEAFVNGFALRIQGGSYKMIQPTGPGMGRGRGIGQGQGRGIGQGRGRMGGQFSAGPGGICKCPNCGHEQQHVRGQPCYESRCPKCNTPMQRG